MVYLNSTKQKPNSHVLLLMLQKSGDQTSWYGENFPIILRTGFLFLRVVGLGISEPSTVRSSWELPPPVHQLGLTGMTSRRRPIMAAKVGGWLRLVLGLVGCMKQTSSGCNPQGGFLSKQICLKGSKKWSFFDHLSNWQIKKHTLMTHKCTKLCGFLNQKKVVGKSKPLSTSPLVFFPVWVWSGGHYITNPTPMHYGNREIPQNSPYMQASSLMPAQKMGDKFMTSHHINSHLNSLGPCHPSEPSRSVPPVRRLQRPLLPDHLGKR